MPAITGSEWLPDALVVRDSVGNATAHASQNHSSDALQVICAWPVSGQYGVGPRYIYYFLVLACVCLHRSEWLRNACLAAALLFPAVAALHGIVLAALHIEGAIDMDIFGAFQMCSIGILAGPVTVRLSGTYWNNPGRNIIFLWTGLVLAGLLSITIQFLRYKTSDCLDSSGGPITISSAEFLDNIDSYTCGLTCSVDDGPFSPMRGGSANNIYIIPAPQKLSFSTATLLSAACCIPPILSLIFMVFKILEIQKKKYSEKSENGERADDLIEGTNGATLGKMSKIDERIRFFLSFVEVPVFSAAVLAILVIGERNFFSPQVRYQVEPIAAVGQWAPIAGTALAALGSLYVLLALDMEKEIRGPSYPPAQGSNERRPTWETSPGAGNALHIYRPSSEGSSEAAGDTTSMAQVIHSSSTPSLHDVDYSGPSHMQRVQSDTLGPRSPGSTDMQRVRSDTLGTVRSQPSDSQDHLDHPSPPVDSGYRRKVAKTLINVGNYFGSRTGDLFDDSEFKIGKAQDYPEIPGENLRNPELSRTRQHYNPRRGSDGNVTPALRGSRSRTGSFINEDGERPDRDSLAVPGLAHVRSASARSLSPHPPQDPP